MIVVPREYVGTGMLLICSLLGEPMKYHRAVTKVKHYSNDEMRENSLGGLFTYNGPVDVTV